MSKRKPYARTVEAPKTTSPLFVDTYPGDHACDWGTFIAAGPPWHGAVFKLSEGLRYQYADWAKRQREPFLTSSRYGVDLFDGFYHYLDLSVPGGRQAEFFWANMLAIGGEKIGTLWAMVDVERGGQRVQLTPDRVTSTTCEFAARYEELSGRKATLYGGELLRASGVKNLLGCGRSAIALYNATLPADVIKRTGTDLDHLLFWQYDGDGEAYLPGYPKEAPGCGKIDISAMVMPGGLDGMRTNFWPNRHPYR